MLFLSVPYRIMLLVKASHASEYISKTHKKKTVHTQNEGDQICQAVKGSDGEWVHNKGQLLWDLSTQGYQGCRSDPCKLHPGNPLGGCYQVGVVLLWAANRSGPDTMGAMLVIFFLDWIQSD